MTERMFTTWERVRPKDQLLVQGLVWRVTDRTGPKVMMRCEATGKTTVGEPSPTREVTLLMPGDPLYVPERGEAIPEGTDPHEMAVALVTVRLSGIVVGSRPDIKTWDGSWDVPVGAVLAPRAMRQHLALMHAGDIDWAGAPDDALADLHAAHEPTVTHRHVEA